MTNRAGSARVIGSVKWDARGLGNRDLTLSVCAAEQNWPVVINRLGRPRLSEAWGPCPELVSVKSLILSFAVRETGSMAQRLMTLERRNTVPFDSGLRSEDPALRGAQHENLHGADQYYGW